MQKKSPPFAFNFIIKILFFIVLGFNNADGQQLLQGVLKDAESGETLIGANVVIKGTTIGTQTDLEGKRGAVQARACERAGRGRISRRIRLAFPHGF